VAIDPVVPRSRRNVLVAAAAGLAGLLTSRLVEPDQAAATTGTMVYGTSMESGVDQTGLTSATTGATALFQNSGSGTAVQGIVAGSQAALLGSNTSVGIGVLGGSSSGIGVEGGSTSGNGVLGTTTSGQGVLGISTSGSGVIGQSTSSAGVIGATAATDKPGVLGQSTGHSSGVIGYSGGGPLGFPPISPADTGVYGYAASGTPVGVRGDAPAGTGVEGISTSGPGVQGTSASGDGVAGTSGSSFGVLGTSSTGIGAGGVSSGVQPGVRGLSESSNTGVFGFSRASLATVPPATPADTGVYGYADQNVGAAGVKGESPSGAGVVGQSFTGSGVNGFSTSGIGVVGESTSSVGSIGASSAPDRPGLYGFSNANNTGVIGFTGVGGFGDLPTTPAKTGVYGLATQDSTAVGVRGESASGTGVVGSGLAGHDLLAGGSGRIGMVPNLSAGPPSTGTYATGDVFCDAAGNLWACVAGGSPGSFRKLAGPATAGALHPINPARVYDSRLSGGPLAAGAVRRISVATATTGGGVVPSGAVAISFNLTIADTVGGGWLGVLPAGLPFGSTSTINWYANGQKLANGGIVKLGGDRQVDVGSGGKAGGSTQFILDITGYYR